MRESEPCSRRSVRVRGYCQRWHVSTEREEPQEYAGQRVRLVGDPSTKRLKFKTGLWPSPNIAAQAGALDPAQESIARNSGGATNLPDGTPELKVVRVHGVDGACQ